MWPDEVLLVQPLHDDDDRRALRRVEPGGDGLGEHPQHGVALQVGERAFDRVRVVVEHPVAAVPGHRRGRHRGAEAGRGVLELELGVLVGGEAERPEPLIPLRLHQPPHPHVVAHRQVLGVRGADVAELRLARGPHSQAGQSTPTASDFIVPGGTLISSRLISPAVTASRCSAIASMCQPCT